MNKADLEKLGLTTEALEKAGLTADVLDKIIVVHGKDIEKHKGAAETSKTEIDTLKNQLTEANKQIENFKGMDVDSIKKTADDYKTKFEQAQVDAAAQVTNIKQSHALERDLKDKHKVKNVKAVMALLNRDALKYNETDDTFVGLDEQVTPLKSSDEYLFHSDAPPPPKIVTGGNSKSVVGDVVVNAARKAAGLTTEQT